jgi:hypothetical protein
VSLLLCLGHTVTTCGLVCLLKVLSRLSEKVGRAWTMRGLVVHIRTDLAGSIRCEEGLLCTVHYGAGYRAVVGSVFVLDFYCEWLHLVDH